jgi:CRP-like cAMP-binding protein
MVRCRPEVTVPSKATPKLIRNRLLKGLPASERRPILAELEILDLERHAGISRAGQPMTHVYFPESCMISVVSTMGNGSCVEAGIIGSRGMSALPVFLDAPDHLLDSFVQVPGRAGRIPAEVFRRSAVTGTTLHSLSLHYASFFLEQVARSAACNALHRLEQRCARWLLLASDELGRPDFSLTHEYLAEMLGVRRASVTDVAAELSQRRLVEYSRGRVRIIDARGLAKAACECYGLVTRAAERMLARGRQRAASGGSR